MTRPIRSNDQWEVEIMNLLIMKLAQNWRENPQEQPGTGPRLELDITAVTIKDICCKL
jgi:hypothetical protein